MAKKPSITTIASGYYSRTALNTNFENLRDKFDNTLSLDGSTPNAMQADLDMNSNDILNAGEVNVNALTIDGVAVFPNTTQLATTYATQNYTGNGSTTTYAMGYNPATKTNVDVYIDGVYQNQDAFNISGTNLTFTAAPPLNSAIEIKVPVNVTDLVASDSSQVTYSQGGTGSVSRTVQSRLRDFVSVKDFGAVGDGVTNDATALYNACLTGKVVHVPSGSYVFNLAAGQVSTVLSNFHNIASDDEITITLPAGKTQFSTGNIMNVSPRSSNIKLIGATPVETTLSSVGSVTGSAGNWSVTVAVADATGIVTGDILDLYNIGPLPILSGDNSVVVRTYPLVGELCNPTVNVGLITASAGGSTASFSSVTGTLSDYIKVNDLLTFKGDTKVVSTVGSSTVGITGTWTASITSSDTFWVTRPNSGTITTSGSSTTITGSSSAFTTEANVGDLLLVNGQFREITAVNSNTDITVDEAITIGSASSYSIIVGAVLHWGSHEVTNVSGNNITVTNKSVKKPPVVGVTTGRVLATKTMLQNTGTGDGIVCEQGASISEIENIAFMGNNSSSESVGLLTNNRISAGIFGNITQQGYVSNVLIGENVAFLNWGRGIFIGHNCSVNAREVSVSGSKSISIWLMENGMINARRMTVSGGSNIGFAVNAGATVLATEVMVIGNNGDGLRLLDGASCYAEAPVLYANAGMNIRAIGKVGAGFSAGVSSLAGGSGAYFDDSQGDFQGFIFASNKREGIECLGMGFVNATQAWISGTSNSAGSGHGVNVTRASIDLTNAGVVGNAGTDIVISGLGEAYLSGANYSTSTLTGGASIDTQNTSFASYTPTVAASSGSITSYTVNNAEWIKRDDAVDLVVDVTITDNGTGSGLIDISLPVATTKFCAIAGVNTTTGAALSAYTTSGDLYVLKYDASYPATTGDRIVFSGTYKL
jgi:hypothetical protein